MSAFQLTIAIPTYNRAKHLESRLQELIPQVQAQHGRVALCVFDDASTDHTPQVVERFQSGLTHHERSPVNLGIGRSMLRTFESTQTGWLWTLGDDDPATPDAVATALELIHQSPRSLAINCNSEGGENSHDFSVSNLPDFLARKDIADVLFMSSNLYNLDVLKPYRKVFCQTIGTLSPHLPTLLAALETSGRPLSFSTKRITVFHRGEQRWSSLEAAMGIASVPLYIKNLENQRLVAQSARRVTRWMLRYGLREVKNADDFLRWKRYTRAVNNLLASQGAGFLTDLPPALLPDNLFLRMAPLLISFLPYWMIKAKAMRMRIAHEGEAILEENITPIPPSL